MVSKVRPPLTTQRGVTFTKLKPNTKYKVYCRGKDVTAACGILHGSFAPGTSRKELVANSKGVLNLRIRYKSEYGSVVGRPGRSQQSAKITFYNYGLGLKMFTYSTSTKNPKNFSNQFPHLVIKESGKVSVPPPVSTKTATVTVSETPNPNYTTKKVTKTNYVTAYRTKVTHASAHQIKNKTITQYFPGDLAQTFYIDKNKVNGSTTVDLRGVNLYFQKKPDADPRKNKSKIQDPDITIAIVPVKNNYIPQNKQIADTIVSVDHAQIAISVDGSAPTEFQFDNPVTVSTNEYYGIIVDISDPDYELWGCQIGHAAYGTNKAVSSTSRGHKGQLFMSKDVSDQLKDVNSNSAKPFKDLHLKFEVDVARYDLTNDIQFNLVNEDYEFFKVNNVTRTGDFYDGEIVYQDTATETGTITITENTKTITGIGTSFLSTLAFDDIVVIADGANTQAMTVADIISDTEVEMNEYAEYDITSGTYQIPPAGALVLDEQVTRRMYLHGSNATATKYFGVGNTIYGAESGATADITDIVDNKLSEFTTDLELLAPSTANITSWHNFTYENGGNYYITSSGNKEKKTDLIEANALKDYQAIIMSRSNEVLNTTNLFNEKSSKIRVNYDSRIGANWSFQSPTLSIDKFNIVSHGYDINNDSTGEISKSGNAICRGITTPFNMDGSAEDLKVTLQAFRPLNTDIEVYARVHNDTDPDNISDKYWTKLTRTVGDNEFSDPKRELDTRQYVYELPDVPPGSASTELAGVVDTITGAANNAFVGSGTDWNVSLAPNDTLLLYNPVKESEVYGIFTVNTVDTEEYITVIEDIEMDLLNDTGLKMKKITDAWTAFNNTGNSGICRYYSHSDGAFYDKFDSVMLKIVLLSDSYSIVPKVDKYELLGVSV